MNLHDAAQNRNAAKGVLTQENIGFGLTILPPSAFKKPGNPSGLPGFFHATIRPKLPGQNCFAPLKQKLGLQSKEKCRHPPSAESACLPQAGILLRKTAPAYGRVCLPAVSRHFTS